MLISLWLSVAILTIAAILTLSNLRLTIAIRLIGCVIKVDNKFRADAIRKVIDENQKQSTTQECPMRITFISRFDTKKKIKFLEKKLYYLVHVY